FRTSSHEIISRSSMNTTSNSSPFRSGESGISTLEVRAFRPDDAQTIALALLSRAEQLNNKLNVRARADAVKFGEEIVRQAEARVSDVHQRMTDFRNREMIVDPSKQSATTLELVAQLTADLALEKAQLDHIMTMTPNSPQIEAMRNRIRAMEHQISQQRSVVTGGDQSMAKKLSEFEQIVLERELAVKSLSLAFVSLENSRQDAQRQQLYLERVVEPHLPDYPLYPKRLFSIVFAFGLCISIFWMVRSFVAAIQGHS
ncbi:MAG: capsule biosynthesis protein, partial [Pseudorhodoplanes sp.]